MKRSVKEQPKHQKKTFNPKDAIFVFSSFSFVCMAVIFILIMYDVLAFDHLLSFEAPASMVIYIGVASLFLLVFGCLLTRYIPSKFIHNTNTGYQNYSLITIFIFMFLGALFEELLFRGIIQNIFSLFIEQEWLSILFTTLLFLSLHVQYFKKPVMLLNITIPSIIFGWIYVQTNNILVPAAAHFFLNSGMTLLFKYNVISLKK
ncbi:CPBP family intramembrane glutamic endopeptidase [Bacillus massiliglaciei]|uniref:CPBP family intramembrane glutamic endopeptidase n=1 Tax=Bacillus massiliglaciei TaxID=1816693 RepID=UPI000DA62EFC|nr:CPBP family intramembrane glutamic endopeptidase [Bacillus massiliglaciei]